MVAQVVLIQTIERLYSQSSRVEFGSIDHLLHLCPLFVSVRNERLILFVSYKNDCGQTFLSNIESHNVLLPCPHVGYIRALPEVLSATGNNSGFIHMGLVGLMEGMKNMEPLFFSR